MLVAKVGWIMAKFIVNERQLRKVILNAIDVKLAEVFTRGGSILIENQAKFLRDAFKNSSEFNDIKTKFVGEFGFTPEELSRLDRILDLLIPGSNDITVGEIKTGIGTKSILLQWVDYEKLKQHDYAQHELTKLDSSSGGFSITGVVSWVEWLQEGVSVIGYEFSPVNARNNKFSRSGEGIMMQSEGTFVLKPTRIFDKIAASSGPALKNIIKNSMGIILQKFGK